MKKVFYLALAASVILASCNKETSGPVAGKDCVVSVEISGGSAVTKTTGEVATIKENEGKVYNLQVFVFDDKGAKEGYDGKDNVSRLEISCKSGQKTVAAVVNAASLSDVTTLDELKAKAVTLAEQNPSKFVMFGSASKFIEGSSNITIDVNKLVSRIVIRSIENAFKLESLQSKTFKVTGIYVINAQGKNSLGMTAYQGTDGDWYNRMKHETSSVESMLYETVGETVAFKQTYAKDYYFYVMPNDFKETESISDAHAGTWSKRYTRLVIEATIDGETCYYPITMDKGLEPNKSYEIDKLVVTKKGSPNPDTPVNSEDVLFKINVVDWTVVLMGNSNDGIVTM